MSEIKTLEDMRNTVKTIAADCDEGWILGCLDAIEAEIAEKYMELPVDADGVPIRVGDKVEYQNGKRDVVRFITVNDGEPTLNERGWIPGKCRHVKPRTVEDVLNDCADEISEKRGIAPELNRDTPTRNEIVDKYADEIRELLGVGE